MEDGPHSKRSNSNQTEENIAPLGMFFDEDRNACTVLVSQNLDSSSGTMGTIIHEDLKMREICMC